MNFTTTLTTKYQLTLPKVVRDKLKVKKGVTFAIYPTNDGFIGIVKRKSKIFDFAGDLKNRDDGKSLTSIRQEAQKNAAKAINKRLSATE